MWPFTRKPKPINPGPINEDWRVGDLAECIVENWENDLLGGPEFGPEKGDVMRVCGVKSLRTIRAGDGWYIALKGFEPATYQATGFRKVPPLNTEASAEFTAKIKAISKRQADAPVRS